MKISLFIRPYQKEKPRKNLPGHHIYSKTEFYLTLSPNGIFTSFGIILVTLIGGSMY